MITRDTKWMESMPIMLWKFDYRDYGTGTIQGTELHWSTCNTEFVLRYTSVGGHAPAVAEQKLTKMGRSSWLVFDCTRAIL